MVAVKTFDEEWAGIRAYYQSGEHQEEIKRSRWILLDRPFVLYGAGVEGVEFANVLKFGQCPPVCFCDKNKSGTEPHTGLRIASPKELLGPYRDASIVISSSLYRREIEGDLLELGVSRGRILPRRLLLLLLLQLCSEGTATYGKYLKRSHYLMLFNALSGMVTEEGGAQLTGCRRTYDWLSDERSRKVFLDYLKLCFIAAPVDPSPLDMQYLDPVMELNDREVFVDCGAYTGDTAEAFMRKVDGRYCNDDWAYYKVAYGGDTIFFMAAASYAKRVGILDETLHRYYLSPKSSSYQWNCGRFKADIALYETACSFLIDKCGAVSPQNRNFLQCVYANAVSDTAAVIQNAGLSPADKLREYHMIAAHPITLAAYRECTDESAVRSRSGLLQKALKAGAALGKEDDRDLRAVMQTLLPRCGQTVTGVNAGLFLEDSALLRSLLQDDADDVLDILLERLENNQGVKKYALPEAIRALAAGGRRS